MGVGVAVAQRSAECSAEGGEGQQRALRRGGARRAEEGAVSEGAEGGEEGVDGLRCGEGRQKTEGDTTRRGIDEVMRPRRWRESNTGLEKKQAEWQQ